MLASGSGASVIRSSCGHESVVSRAGRAPRFRTPVGRSGSRGFTLVELLVVAAVLGIILSVVAAFFTQQARVTRRVQATNELNILVRNVAEALAQDFQLAGARAVVDGARRSSYVRRVDQLCTVGGVRDSCVVLDADVLADDPATSTLPGSVSVVYVSSLRLPAGADVDADAGVACRVVQYVLEEDGALYRSDTECGESDPFLPTGSVTQFANLFAEGVVSIEVRFVCEDGAAVAQPQGCYHGDSEFVREVRLRVEGQSVRDASLTETVSLAALMPNMRPPVTFE